MSTNLKRKKKNRIIDNSLSGYRKALVNENGTNDRFTPKITRHYCRE